MDAYIATMRRYAGSGGRMSRTDFWLFWLVYAIIIAVAATIETAFNIGGRGPGILVRLIGLAHLIPQLSATGRRMHDRDWHAAWALVPPVAFVVALLPGTPGPNRYGPPPDPAEAPPRGSWARAEPAPPVNTPAPAEARPAAPQRAVEPTVAMPASPMPRQPAPAPSTATTGSATLDQIERLVRLRSEGHLTNEEFQALKAQELGQRGIVTK